MRLARIVFVAAGAWAGEEALPVALVVEDHDQGA